MQLKLPFWHLVNKILVLHDAMTIKLEIMINGLESYKYYTYVFEKLSTSSI